VALAAEIADGWLPFFLSPRHFSETYQPHLEAGFARAGRSDADAHFDISATVPVVVGDSVEAARNQIKPLIALYVGGMGARKQNFYYNLACRYGYEDAANQIQDAFLAGDKGAAMAAVPDALVDEIALCGPRERIAERLTLWQDSPITTINVLTTDITAVRVMAELLR
jgi:alkanesulfonate monooxygenase SsuD/methylene tetrahydromethanopterin reductase-like flavin-dependent oxidoreductase (luciferase family)